MIRFRRGAPAALLGALACASPAPEPRVTVSDGRYVMGTVLEITLVARDPESGRAALDALFARALALEALFTTWDAESPVSRLNDAAGRGPQAVPDELIRLVSLSREYARLTGGSFDVTVGPLVALWRDAAESNRLPSEEALSRARARVGAERIAITPDGIALPEGVALDLGGIAKGYALERMLPLLRARGIESALLNFGQSSVWALGAPPDSSEGWRLLARAPAGGILGLLVLRDRALSISGSLGQFVEIEGRRYGHVLDPRSGRPLERRRQALVVAPDAALAEALSTALLVLGEKGIALVASQPGCEGMLVDAGGGVWSTSGFGAVLEPLPVRAAGGARIPAGAARDLKAVRPGSDPEDVKTADISCPVCSADIPLSGEEQRGDEIFCPYCAAPCRLTAEPTSESCRAEEDF